MKVLMLCNTRYQIINAINAKMSLFVDDDVDFICISEQEDINNLTLKIRELRIFNKVLRVKSDSVDCHVYLKNFLLRKNDGTKLSSAIRNTMSIICDKLRNKEEDDILIRNIDGYQKGEYKKYNKILANCNKEIVNIIYKLVKKNKLKCEMSILDEGVNSYCTADMGGYGTGADSAYLYEPDLCVNGIKKIYTLPKIRNQKIKNAINYVFGWENKIRSINNSILIFEQPYRKMPNYFIDNKILRVVLHNSYKKHMKQAVPFEYQKKLISHVIGFKSNREKYIKYHPASFDASEYVWESGIKEMENHKTPWEVQLLNQRIDNNIFITVASTAAYASELFNEAGDNIYVFLFDIDSEAFGITSAKREYFMNMLKQNPEKVFIPKSLEELDTILNRII